MAGKTTSVTARTGRSAVATLSGAQIQLLPANSAKTFLQRHDQCPRQPIGFALGAFEDSGSLIGVLAIQAETPTTANILLAVAPERRRLKIATDLVHTFTAQYLTDGGRLEFSHPDKAEPAVSFVGSLGLDVAPLHQRMRSP